MEKKLKRGQEVVIIHLDPKKEFINLLTKVSVEKLDSKIATLSNNLLVKLTYDSKEKVVTPINSKVMNQLVLVIGNKSRRYESLYDLGNNIKLLDRTLNKAGSFSLFKLTDEQIVRFNDSIVDLEKILNEIISIQHADLPF